jgi:hypothetical protein
MKKQNNTFLRISAALFILLIIAAVFTSCDLPKKPAVGIEDEILVVADSAEYYELEPELLSVLVNLFILRKVNLFLN